VDKLKNWKGAFFFILILNLAFFGWFFGIRDGSFVNFKNEHPLIDPSRSFIDQKNFIINLQPLRIELRKLVAEQKNKDISLYFEFLNTGANIAINQDIKVWPASFPKLPVAMAVVKKVEKGIWSFNQEFELLEQDKDNHYGFLFNQPAGTKFKLEELLKYILVYSDNTAYKILLRNLSDEELNEVTTDLGLEELFTSEGLVSAKEYSRLFRSLYTSSFLKRENSEKILNFLGHTELKNFLAQGIPNGVFFSHKFGIDRANHSYLDSGLVFVPNRPYLITVAIRGLGAPGEEGEINDFMKSVGELTYKYISEY
jgi:hypothetical protein